MTFHIQSLSFLLRGALADDQNLNNFPAQRQNRGPWGTQGPELFPITSRSGGASIATHVYCKDSGLFIQTVFGSMLV